jgi:uncharacterized protein (UPF0276 family)
LITGAVRARRVPRIAAEDTMTQAPLSPTRAGIGLRAPHHADLIELRPALGFVEVHSENYFGGGAPLAWLMRARRDYPVSLHGVGSSIGSCDPLSESHLDALSALIDRVEPALVSEHLCWSSSGGVYANDLLPLPCTEEALAHVAARVQRVQERLRRRILIENVSSYLEYADAAMPEWTFLAEVAARSGCGLLLDVNNVFVSASNHGFDARRYIDAIPPDAVDELHLAGFTRNAFAGGEILIDTHSRPVDDAVWSLFAHALQCLGARPTLIEWDAELPPLAALVAEARKADALLAARAAQEVCDGADCAA